MRNTLIAGCALAGLVSMSVCKAASAPETFTPNDVHDRRDGAYALVGATVHSAPGQQQVGATVLIRDGRIVAVDQQAVPAEYARIDVSGMHLYAGFIDLNSGYGLPAPEAPTPFMFSGPQVLDSATPGAYSNNGAVRSEFQAVEAYAPNLEAAKALREIGYSAVLSHRADGIARGTGALVALSDDLAQNTVLIPQASAHYSLAKGSSAQLYPISQMGAVALLRQSFLDARWYAAQPRKPFVDLSLEGWNASQSLPQFTAVDGWIELLRAQRVADEFERRFIYLGNGNEYQQLQAVAATGADIVVPLNFPKALEDKDPTLLRMTDLATLQHWEQAPYNPARLSAAGVRIALTSAGMEKDQYKQFWPNLREAIKRGLSPDQALAALTTAPAKMLGVDGEMGKVAAGYRANLLITSAPIDDESMQIYDHWINGQRHPVAPIEPDLRGRWQLSANGAEYLIEVSGSRSKVKAKRIDPPEGESDKVEWQQSHGRVVIHFELPQADLRVAGRASGDQIFAVDGNAWSATKVAAAEAPAKDDTEDSVTPTPGALTYPMGAYGRLSRPAQQHLLFRNATVWTNEAQGIVDNTDVRVRDGKIAEIGTDLAAAGAVEIDASGRHLTAGVIDEHSHLATNGVNDIATNSAMVRIRDSLDSTDVGIYRNLAGGVTASQILHGSANPIGGQSALIKMRWGVLPDELLIDGADGFIKFALGENVKSSSNPASIRYPATRMGVAQFMEDAFDQAEQYRDEWARWRGLSSREQKGTPAPRVDLVNEALVEVLESKRFISAHSYVQSEILMLMRVAERHDFRVNTFTHILEGYKVADRMAEHGAGGSSFADWWAYKMEVVNAIPYNNALMEQAGVITAVNSDSGEMSRRLNQEAAKTIKYGNLTPEKAWKLVTLHSAKLLHLDDRMGSIKVGKDADLVLWNDQPLSINARADYTLVDGRVEYQRELAESAEAAISSERHRLLDLMQQAKSAGAPTQAPSPKPARVFHCDDISGYEYLQGASHAH